MNEVRYKLLICSSLLLACDCFSLAVVHCEVGYLHALVHTRLLDALEGKIKV